MKDHCESCLMPLKKDTGKRESEKYCSHCFQNGQFCYQGTDLKEFQKYCYESMVHGGMNRWKAKFFSFMVRFAPRWKN
jgi:hypothetical protein